MIDDEPEDLAGFEWWRATFLCVTNSMLTALEISLGVIRTSWPTIPDDEVPRHGGDDRNPHVWFPTRKVTGVQRVGPSLAAVSPQTTGFPWAIQIFSDPNVQGPWREITSYREYEMCPCGRDREDFEKAWAVVPHVIERRYFTETDWRKRAEILKSQQRSGGAWIKTGEGPTDWTEWANPQLEVEATDRSLRPGDAVMAAGDGRVTRFTGVTGTVPIGTVVAINEETVTIQMGTFGGDSIALGFEDA